MEQHKGHSIVYKLTEYLNYEDILDGTWRWTSNHMSRNSMLKWKYGPFVLSKSGKSSQAGNRMIDLNRTANKLMQSIPNPRVCINDM